MLSELEVTLCELVAFSMTFCMDTFSGFLYRMLGNILILLSGICQRRIRARLKPILQMINNT